ncbi:type 1 glutamine amidotransferase domain-containing protein [Pseudomonas indica]|uniref:type 1 glutamine amidotransferase domain-containing protein n=1 Tax=Pseudomonas indica TaxID=137658 RepID=UPI003FD1EEBA
MSRHVLIVVTSADRMPNGEATGLWLEEFAVPYHVFKEAGYRITVASPKGGETPIDPRSRDELQDHPEWTEVAEMLRHTGMLDSRLKAADFDAIFLPGGHGTMFDLPGHPELGRLLAEFDEQGKVWAAVCHGPAGFVGPKRADDLPLVEGREMTAFTDSEEHAVGLEKAVPFLLESTLRELGAIMKTAPDFSAYAIRDRNLITGQNPPSSAKTAQLVVEALS